MQQIWLCEVIFDARIEALLLKTVSPDGEDLAKSSNQPMVDVPRNELGALIKDCLRFEGVSLECLIILGNVLRIACNPHSWKRCQHPSLGF